MLDEQVTALRKHNAYQAKDIPIFEKILFFSGRHQLSDDCGNRSGLFRLIVERHHTPRDRINVILPRR
jgi:hypothetical protein